MTSSASDAPFYIADEKGYFEEEGLTVEFVPFDSAAKMIAPLGGGQLDVGAGAPSAGFYNAVARDVNLRIVADKGSMPENYGYMPLLVRKELVDSGKVKDIGDLKGLKIAEPAEATATSSTLATILDSAGMSYDDVSHEFIGFGEHPAAFANGAIDAALTTEPSATVAEEQGAAVRLASPPEFYDNQQLAVVLYSDVFAKESPAVAQCFMNAYLQGARDYATAFVDGELQGDNADEVVSIVTEATGLDEALYRKIVPNFVNPNGEVNVESLQKDYDFFEAQGFLEDSVDIDEIVDPSFAEAAVEELGEFEGNG
jgi:NitT/TauT family transport system substrate-binding protein